MMEMRPFKKEDYPDVASWWEQQPNWDGPAMPYDYLSDGLIVPGKAAGFLYEIKINCGSAGWVEMPVACPENTPRESSEALRVVLAGLIQLARQKGFVGCQSFVYGSGMQKMFAEAGFTMGLDVKEATLHF